MGFLLCKSLTKVWCKEKVQMKKYAFNKKSTIFTQWLRNFVKMKYYEDLILTKFRND